jgi:uncharacterized protein with ACT and thioredoxin-like domain
VSLSGFSQTDTKSDSIVQLKVPIAKLVIKDILSGDGAKAELKEVYKMLDEKNTQIGLYKQKDSLKDEKIANLNVIIDKKDQQFALEREKSNSLLKELKVQKFKTAIYKAGSGIAVLMTVLFLVK